MKDVPEDCEGAYAQLQRWINALMVQDFDVLEEVLAADFQFTVEPRYRGGRMDKAEFIALDRKIESCTIDLMEVTMRRRGPMITSLIFAEVTETLSEDPGPGMPSREEMNATMQRAHLAYGSGFRLEDDGQWRCFSHHIFGFLP